MHNDLYNWLKTNATLVTEFGDRVYHEWAPQGVEQWPQLVFQQQQANEVAEDFDSLGQQVLELVSYQFDVYARSSQVVVESSGILISQLRLLRGTIGSVDIQHTELVNSIHLGEIVGDKQVRRVSSDFLIYYNPSEA